MPERVITHDKCPNDKCNSSDAYCEWDNGHGHCFSCGYHKYPKGDKISNVSRQYVPHRGLSRNTLRIYNILTDVVNDVPKYHNFFYSSNNLKVRNANEKRFFVRQKDKINDPYSKHPLYGMNVFPKGSSDTIFLTEGEYDAASVYEMVGLPAVSVKSATSAKRDCSQAYDYLNSFKKIYLAFDNDGPGKEAEKSVASLFDHKKVYIVPLSPYKDANDYLTKKAQDKFRNLYRYAKRYMPDGVVSTYNEIERILNRKRKQSAASYPFKTLQEMTYGLRLGEIVLISGDEGIGKTEFVRALECNVLRTEESNIAVLHLEEDEERVVQGIIGNELKFPIHLPDCGVDIEEQLQAYKRLTKREERLHIYSHYGTDDPDNIIDLVRFLVTACDCKFVFLDHISMIITGLGVNNDKRNMLDYLVTRLSVMAKEQDFCFVFIAHTNDDGQIRDSRYPSKIANTHIRLERDLEHPDPVQKSITKMTLFKNRFGAKTGEAGQLIFDPISFTLMELEDE